VGAGAYSLARSRRQATPPNLKANGARILASLNANGNSIQ
jgi:hypothetical protein